MHRRSAEGSVRLADGLAASEALRLADPEAFEALSTIPVEFHYDVGDDIVCARSPIIEVDHQGNFRGIRFSPRLDYAPAIDERRLDALYRGRQWLATYLNSPEVCYRFSLRPGDVLVMDNRRTLHGREAFVMSSGDRFLQGCYLTQEAWRPMWITQRREQTRREQQATEEQDT
ncbi:MAG: TauD/TfdA family dioxygenase [Acidimicrobiales bacterium]